MSTEYNWPDWVPQELRSEIETEWHARGGRDAWESERLRLRAPQIGETKTATLHSSGEEWITGRYVYISDGVGAVIGENGSFWRVLNGDD